MSYRNLCSLLLLLAVHACVHAKPAAPTQPAPFDGTVASRTKHGLATVTIKAGCRTDAEAWIAIMMVGIAPPPPKSGRVNVTTC